MGGKGEEGGKGDSWSKGEGKGGGKGGNSWSKGWQSSNQEQKPQAPRDRVLPESLSGRVIQWKGTYGWIEPSQPIDHPDMAKQAGWQGGAGRIFVHAEDVVPKWRSLTVGALVEFFLYHDGQGLGAEECIARKVLRLTLPWNAAQSTFGQDGENLPAFEGQWHVTVRAYQWMLADGSNSGLPFLLFEVWGRPQAIVEAVLEITRKGNRCQAEMLVPESRLWKVHLGQLQRCCKGAQLSQDLKITDPMPCRTLTLKGGKDECGQALEALIAQVCD